jgi:hypothetical protein
MPRTIKKTVTETTKQVDQQPQLNLQPSLVQPSSPVMEKQTTIVTSFPDGSVKEIVNSNDGVLQDDLEVKMQLEKAKRGLQ